VKPLLRILDLVLYTSVFTACCATGLFMATERFINGVAPQLVTHVHLLVFGSTLLVYNAPRILRKPKLNQPFRRWYFVFFFIGLATAASGLPGLSWPLVAGGVFIAAFTFAYSLPLLPFKNKKRLRDFGWLKILVLAGVWTSVTSLLPILCWHKHIAAYPFEILLRFIFIFALCIVFDIRDIATDHKNSIETLPYRVGLQNSYRLIDCAIALFIVLSIVQYIRYPVDSRLVAAISTGVATKMVVVYLRRSPSDRAYLLLADGMMLFYAALALIG
jgi:4-hydroxybenzoate polyprenyltransferase